MDEATCPVCGKHFKYPKTPGRKRVYCSVVCSNKARNEKADKTYWRRKYEDKEWAEKRRAYYRESYKQNRGKDRNERFTEIAEVVRSAETIEDAVAILDENTRLRTRF